MSNVVLTSEHLDAGTPAPSVAERSAASPGKLSFPVTLSAAATRAVTVAYARGQRGAQERPHREATVEQTMLTTVLAAMASPEP